MKVYLIGSLRNPRVPEIANALDAAGFRAFDEWYSAGERADDSWETHQKQRGRTYRDALAGPAANNVVDFDFRHLQDADAAVLVWPAGKSGAFELGCFWSFGVRPAFILMEAEPEGRWDAMFATVPVVSSVDELIARLRDWQAVPF